MCSDFLLLFVDYQFYLTLVELRFFKRKLA